MRVPLHPVERRLSDVLRETAHALPAGSIMLKELFEHVGEQGLLLLCVLLALPFLIPVSIPGVAIVFGLSIVLIAWGVTINRVPWLPQRLLRRTVPAAALARVLERGAKWFERAEHLVRPRWLVLTRPGWISAVNGLVLLTAGLTLAIPLPPIPLANTLPALAVILLAVGSLQRDGVVLLLGYAVLVKTFGYLGTLTWLTVAKLLPSLFGSG